MNETIKAKFAAIIETMNIAETDGVVGIIETKLGFVELWFAAGYWKLTGNGNIYLHTTNGSRMAQYLATNVYA